MQRPRTSLCGGHGSSNEDEALLIEVEPPQALYWSVALGNHWWETIDYANHQSSLNGFQAVLDDDGVFRTVVCSRDPGVTNWLDNGGHRQGPMIFRWLRADSTPCPRRAWSLSRDPREPACHDPADRARRAPRGDRRAPCGCQAAVQTLSDAASQYPVSQSPGGSIAYA